MATDRSEDALVITYDFDAPRDLVFQAWSDCDRVMRWWGPEEFTTPFCEMDFRVGGKCLSCMRSPEGQEFWGVGVYREIVRPERIVCTDSFSDDKGNVVPATHYGMSEDFPREMLIDVTFEQHNGGTRLTLRHIGMPAGEEREGAREGWTGSFNKLARYLADEIGKMKKAA